MLVFFFQFGLFFVQYSGGHETSRLCSFIPQDQDIASKSRLHFKLEIQTSISVKNPPVAHICI